MISYSVGGIENLDLIQPLFERLSAYHHNTSKYFSKEFEQISYEERKKLISKKQHVHVMIAHDKNGAVGYLVSSVHQKQGEVESLYVDDQYRGYDIGDELMRNSLEWIKSRQPLSIKISVAYGNEVLSFYEKYGFYPRSIILKDLEKTS